MRAGCLSFYSLIGCRLKQLSDLCELNHWSLDLLEGRPFKPFGCSHCEWKSGPKVEWEASVEAHAQLEGAALKQANLVHSREHHRHYPYNPPGLHQVCTALLERVTADTNC